MGDDVILDTAYEEVTYLLRISIECFEIVAAGKFGEMWRVAQSRSNGLEAHAMPYMYPMSRVYANRNCT